MPRKRTGRPRGRPAGHSPNRLRADAIGIALSALGCTPTTAARWATRLANPHSTALFENDRISLILGKELGTPQNVDRYAQKRLTTKNAQFAYSDSEAKFVSLSSGVLLMMLGCRHVQIAASIKETFPPTDWPPVVIDRLFGLAMILNSGDPGWTDPAEIPARVTPEAIAALNSLLEG